MRLTLAYSPCPNDTFMFHDLALGALRLPGYEFDVRLHDVETLNQRALECFFDITKLSFHAYLLVRDRYELLDAGAALGFGCGPVLVAERPLNRQDIKSCRIAIPGRLTTAHLLFQIWAPSAEDKVFVSYDRIAACLAAGEADCGLLIHEGRFTYERQGLQLVVDLGAWWEKETRLPLPLGCVAARKDLPRDVILEFGRLLRLSIQNSQANIEGTLDYVRQHAQELDNEVIEKHIETFVNAYSLELADDGRAAVAKLEALARAAGVLS